MRRPEAASARRQGAADGGLSVVVPVYDEAANVAPLAAEIVAALDRVAGAAPGGGGYEIIFVDDGSSDGTGEALRALRRTLPQLRVLRHRRNCGQSAALMTGVAAARGAWIVTLDGDGQNDPADVPRLLAALGAPEAPENLAMVAGVRVHRRDPWIRRAGSRLANGVRARLLGDDTPDTGCGLKLIRREAYLAMPYFDHMHRFLPALVQRDGGAVVHVEVSHRPRRSGASKYGLGVGNRLWAGIVDLVGVMWLQRRAVRPVVEADEVEEDDGGDADA